MAQTGIGVDHAAAEAGGDLRPRRWPSWIDMIGEEVALEPLDPARHAADLHRAGHADARARAIWTYLPDGPFADAAGFRRWAEAAAAKADPQLYAIRRRPDGPACGVAGYLNIRPRDGVIELGSIWFAPSLQRSRAATEALFLMMDRAFGPLGYRRLEWKCNALNAASRRAALRLGFRPEGLFRQHMIVKGASRDTAWFAITDREWPPLRRAIADWLAPSNFGPDGTARRALSAATAALVADAADVSDEAAAPGPSFPP